jgi:glycosyltransferase involved in cell wall biosynthesis
VKKKILRERYNFCESTKIFLSVSELNNRKNVQAIINCFNIIDDQDAKLIIVGSGPAESKLKNLAASNCNIIFTGEVVNTNEYYNIADYFISASFSEGLPYSVLEAMASGLPVILSDIPGHRSIFKTGDEYPYFFSNLDILNFKMCIEIIEKDDYKSISEKMYHIVRKNYSAKKMSNRYQDFYEHILLSSR